MRDSVLLAVCALILAAFTSLTLMVVWVLITGRGVVLNLAGPDSAALVALWLGWFQLLRAINK